MKLRLYAMFLALALFLGGCSWPDGSYHSVTPHLEQNGSIRAENLAISNREEMVAAMEMMVVIIAAEIILAMMEMTYHFKINK